MQGTVGTKPVHSLLDDGERCTSGSAVAFNPAFRELEQESLGRRYTTRGPAFTDCNHPTQDRLIRGFTMTAARTTRRIATPALGKTCLPRRLAITGKIAFPIIRWITR